VELDRPTGDTLRSPTVTPKLQRLAAQAAHDPDRVLTTLASLIPEEIPHEVELVDEGIHDVDTNASADLVGMTVITGTAKRAYELATKFRERGIPGSGGRTSTATGRSIWRT